MLSIKINVKHEYNNNDCTLHNETRIPALPTRADVSPRGKRREKCEPAWVAAANHQVAGGARTLEGPAVSVFCFGGNFEFMMLRTPHDVGSF